MPLLFNPENDLALGVGCSHYTPPPRVSALHDAGALMPAWWAREDDYVLAPDADESVVEWLRREYGLRFDVGAGGLPEPWGWSSDARRQFLMAGVRPEVLPSDAEIDGMRMLSHRRTSVEILRRLGIPELAGREIAVPEELHEPSFIKSPWSCSGRGVFSSRGMRPDVVMDRMAGMIHRQGSVMVEREYAGIRNFAALFRSDGGRVAFAGWSVFETGPGGSYSGNLVAPQGVLEERIGHNIEIEPIGQVLSEIIAPFYAGPLGIDMMVYEEDGREKVHPCIELNLRMTMGFVAMEVQRRLGLDSPALLGWEYGKPAGTPLLVPRHGFALTLR